MNDQKPNGFNYTYSAKEQAELKKIRETYTSGSGAEFSGHTEADKLARIKKLDADVSRRAMAVSLTVGIICTLIMGFGMSLIMTDLKEILGLQSNTSLTIGIGTGFVGMIGVVAAYPLYQRILRKKRQKIAPEILRLCEELMEPGNDSTTGK